MTGEGLERDYRRLAANILDGGIDGNTIIAGRGLDGEKYQTDTATDKILGSQLNSELSSHIRSPRVSVVLYTFTPLISKLSMF